MSTESIFSGLGSAVGLAQGIGGLVSGGPGYNPPPAPTPRTPGYTLTPGGKLTRQGLTGPLFQAASTLPAQSSQIRAQMAQPIQNVSGLRPVLADIAGRFPGLLKNISEIQQGLTPGFGKVTEAAVNAIKNQYAKAAGDLSTQLARRGVLGASFANDAQSALAGEFAQKEAEARANAFIAETELQQNFFQLTDQTLKDYAQLVGQQLGLEGFQVELLGSELSAQQNELQQYLSLLGFQLDELNVAQSYGKAASTLASQQALDSAKIRILSDAAVGAAASQTKTSLSDLGSLFNSGGQ